MFTCVHNYSLIINSSSVALLKGLLDPYSTILVSCQSKDRPISFGQMIAMRHATRLGRSGTFFPWTIIVVAIELQYKLLWKKEVLYD